MDKKRQQGIHTMVNLLKGQVSKKEATEAHFEPGVVEKTGHPVVLRTTPVCWGIPYDEVQFSKAARSLLQCRPMPWDDFISVEHTYLAAARTTIHNQFLEFGLCDWLVMLDSDVCMAPDYISRLLAHHKADPSKKVLGGWYRVKSEPFYPIIYTYKGAKLNFKDASIEWWQHWDIKDVKPGLQEVDGAGAGCWLIHRDVIKAIGPDPFDLLAGGEDLQLCRLIAKVGYKLWIDGDLRCAHVGVGVA